MTKSETTLKPLSGRPAVGAIRLDAWTDHADVAYEDWQGHKLDRTLLDLLQQF